jgi:glycosyltransferase involved in cell wall biosynthesis
VAGSSVRRARWRWSHRSHLRAERAAITGARIVLVNSERTGRDVVERLGVPAARVHRAYYGIDPSIYRPRGEGERPAAKARLGWGPQPVAAFIGGLGDRRKSFDVVFDAWEMLAGRAGWDVDLAVIGAGAELPDWISRAKTCGLSGRIHFLGFRKDVPDILAACDAMIAPAKYEAYGMAVQECLCMGLPALASRISGVSEQYPEELNELLIEDPGDPQELVDRLWNWRQRKDHFESLVLQLSSRLRMHTWEKMTAEVLRIVNSG